MVQSHDWQDDIFRVKPKKPAIETFEEGFHYHIELDVEGSLQADFLGVFLDFHGGP